MNGLKHCKKIFAFSLAALMFVTVLPTTFASTEINKKIGDMNAATFDAYSMGEIEAILMEYMSENYPDIQPDSEEFYNFIVEQLLGDNKDESLINHENYDLIHTYLTEYKVRYEDYLLCKAMIQSNDPSAKAMTNDIMEDCTSIKYNRDKTDVIYDTSIGFSDLTIREIKAENEAREAELLIESTVTPKAVYGYSPSRAISYARRWAKAPYNTPTYCHFPDWSQGYGGTDCANFVSQCLVAGGLSMDGTTNYAGITESTTQWYSKTFERYTGQGAIYYSHGLTTAWSRAKDFDTYMSRRLGPSNVVTWTSLTNMNNNCRAGDPIGLVNSAGTVWHVVIITAKGSTTSSTKYCGHSNDRCDEPISTFSSQDNYRVYRFA